MCNFTFYESGVFMFCEKCGKKLNESANFCPNCGAKNDNMMIVFTNDNKTVNEKNTEFNRTVLKQYLFDVRSLECAKLKLSERLNVLKNEIDRLCIPKKIIQGERSFFDNVEWDMVGYAVILAVACLVVGYVANIVVEWLFDSDIVLVIGIALAVIIVLGDFIYIIYSIIVSLNDNDEYQKKYVIDVAAEKDRMEKETLEKNELMAIYDDVNKEYEQVTLILENAYSVNIVPQQFRNLYAVYYLYDYISTSNESFKDALLNCNLDEIKKQLAVVIEQQKEIILNQSIIISQNQEMIMQNNRIIRQISKVEQNTELSAQYSKVAAVNAEACAWIGVANYISK